MWFFFIPTLISGLFLIPRKSEASTSNFLNSAFKTFGEIFGPPTMNSIDTQALALAKQEISAKEGRRKDVYKDSLGILTVGIGHRVLPSDGLVYGQVISDAQIDKFFNDDINKAFKAAKSQAKVLKKYRADLIAALTSVNFQLGTGWTSTFSNTWNDLKEGDIDSAISRLKQSKWNKQTPVRVAAFINVLETAFA